MLKRKVEVPWVLAYAPFREKTGGDQREGTGIGLCVARVRYFDYQPNNSTKSFRKAVSPQVSTCGMRRRVADPQDHRAGYRRGPEGNAEP